MAWKRFLGLVAGAVVASTLIHAGPLPAIEIGSDPTWPEFHGAGRSNISAEKGLLKKWPAGGPRLLWKYRQLRRGLLRRVDRRWEDLHGRRLRRCGNDPGARPARQIGVDGAERRGLAEISPRIAHHAHLQEGVLFQMNPAGRLAAFARPIGQGTLGRGSQGGVRRRIWSLGPGRERDRRRRQGPVHAGRPERPRRGVGQAQRQDAVDQYPDRTCGGVLLAAGGQLRRHAAVDHAHAEVGGRRRR